MSFWTLGGFAKAVHGRWVVQPADADTPIRGLTQDTRAIRPGMAYLALRGERFDGHDFVQDAFKQGASLALVEQDSKPADERFAEGGGATGPVLAVPSTVAALQTLAETWRDELALAGCRVIAIAGSNGKTSTRHLIHQVLHACGLPGSESPKSFNNHLGLPLTLLGAKATDRYVAAEVGTNHPGEIAQLGAICRPDIAVITSIGEEHLEFFHDLKGVAREEASLLRFLRPDGLAILSSQAARHTAPFEQLPSAAQRRVADAAAGLPADLHLPGAHGRANAALALAVARHLGADETKALAALRHATPMEGRWQVLEYAGGARAGGLTVIHDAYNANPTSLAGSLDAFEKLARAAHGRGRFIPVLGDMFELGEASAAAHHDALRRVQLTAAFRPAFFLGHHYGRLERELQEGHGEWVFHPAWSDDLPARIAAQVQPGDTVLLKGSRGMRLERLLPALAARVSAPPPASPH